MNDGPAVTQVGADLALVADIGATNARFALASADGAFQRVQVLPCREFDSLERALEGWVGGPVQGLRAAALAVAGPVTGDRVSLTNHPWSFSTEALRRYLGAERLHVVNDFAAVAMAAPLLRADERRQVGGGAAERGAPIAVIGPGSGLGVSGLIPVADDWQPLSGEGGHATMAAAGERENAVLERMRRRFDHVSAERLLSGPGLINIYQALAELDGVKGEAYRSSQITDPEIRARDPRCQETVEIFCAMLGTVAGNLALTLGARGGVYIAGGIVPRLGEGFAAAAFRARFEDKGRLRSYLEPIPAFVVIHPFPAFLGLAKLLFDWRKRPPEH